MINDLFIHFRKIKAYLSQQHAAVSSLETLAQTIVVMRIIVLADEQAHIEK